MTTIPSYVKSVNHYQGEAQLLHPLKAEGQLDHDRVPEGTFYQEKYDGSQFAFGLCEDGSVSCRSKRRDLVLDDAGPFQQGVDSVLIADRTHGLTPGASYFGEFFRGKRQNQIVYDRAPVGYIVLFDVRLADGTWLEPEELDAVAADLGLQRARSSRDYADVVQWSESSLGGPIEGYVVKNHRNPVFGKNGRLMVKHVSPAFRESRGTKVKKVKAPSKADALFATIAQRYSNPARWEKVVQHLRDDGALDGSMKDMPVLMKELNRDILEDHADDIREEVFKFAWKAMSKKLVGGLAQWYQGHLQAEAEGFVPAHKAWGEKDGAA